MFSIHDFQEEVAMATENAGYRDVTGRFHLKAVKDLQGSTTAGQTIRLSLDVSPELYETLNTLAAKLHSTKSDVLRKAIVLLEVAVRAKEENKKFGVAAPDQTLETEIVGL
jgi:predicted transcriptional regulator